MNYTISFQIIKLIVNNGNFFSLAYTKIIPYLDDKTIDIFTFKRN
jgi:hypothetical protein